MPTSVICPSCGSKLRVPDSLRSSSRSAKCPKCSAAIWVPAPASTASADVDAAWDVASGKQKVGPLTSAQLRHMAQTGQLRPECMLLQAGQPKWVPAASVAGLYPATTLSSGSPIKATVPTAAKYPLTQRPIPIPEPLRQKEPWFRMGLPIVFEPVENAFCYRCQAPIKYAEVRFDFTVECTQCGTFVRMSPGIRWANHGPHVETVLDTWLSGGYGDELFPSGAFGAMKRRHESALAKAQELYEQLINLGANNKANPQKVIDLRKQFDSWYDIARDLMAVRKRAVAELRMKARSDPTARPGSKWVFTEDDAKMVPPHLIPPGPGNPDGENYEVIG